MSPGSPIELSLTREPLKKQKGEQPTAVSISLDLDNGDGHHQEEKETIEIIEGRDETQIPLLLHHLRLLLLSVRVE